jgi:hypothetical protein
MPIIAGKFLSADDGVIESPNANYMLQWLCLLARRVNTHHGRAKRYNDDKEYGEKRSQAKCENRHQSCS